MGPASDLLDRRRRAHEALAARLTLLGDEQLRQLLGGVAVWRANVHGNQSGVIELDGVKIFVKQIALTDVERRAEGSTANHFDLPTFYQYGVGSSGFGAWRELQACARASGWALSGEQPCFPFLHHWRVLPRARPVMTPAQQAWLDRAPDYWEQSPAIRARLEAISSATATVVLFLEYVPEMLDPWLKASLAAPGPDATREAKILQLHDQLRDATAFINGRGMQHFDLHAFNVLTDGKQVYIADFGLALCEDFELSVEERAFFDTHQDYDRSYISWAFVEAVTPKTGPSALTPAVQDRVTRCMPVARVMGHFLDALSDVSKATPYPHSELAAALADQSRTN